MPIPATPAEAGAPELSHTPYFRLRSAIFDGTVRPGERLEYGSLATWLGLSTDRVRGVLRELARAGLVDVRDSEYPRVARPELNERDEIIQCIGALLGGVARVTIPTLTDVGTQTLVTQLELVIQSLAAHEPYEYAAHTWGMIDALIHDCPNSHLARATYGRIETLAFLISLTETEEQPEWGRLESSFTAFREAVKKHDAISAELAVEAAFRITSRSSASRALPTSLSRNASTLSEEIALAQMVGAFLGGVVRLTVGTVPQHQLVNIVNAAECAEETARDRDADEHREWSTRLVRELLALCPNRHLVNAVRGTLDSLGDRVNGIWVQQASNWDIVLDGYQHFIPALREQDAIVAELSFEQACLL